MSRRRKHYRANAAKKNMTALYVGVVAVGGAAVWYFMSRPKQPGAYAPGTGAIVYRPQPPIPAAQGVSTPTVPTPPADAMPDWMKAAIAAGALIPAAVNSPATVAVIVGTPLVVNAAYDCATSDQPWWMKAATVYGALIPGALPGTIVLNAAYNWWTG